MHHKSGKHDLQRDLHQLVDTVAPRIESAVTTVAERTPPLIEKGRTLAGEAAQRGKVVAVEKGTLLADRIPDDVVDRLPDRVSDRLPTKRRGRGKKLLLLAILGAAVAAVAAKRRSQPSGGSGRHQAPTPPPADAGPVSTGPTSTTSEPTGQADPSDPLVEPHINGRIN